MKSRRIAAAMLMAVVVVSAMAIPVLAKGVGDGGKPGSSVLYLSGTPKEIGLQYGSLAKDAISLNVANFWGRIADMGMSKDALISDALDLESDLSSSVTQELKGMAKSSGVPYEELLAFNMFGESEMEQPECTCFVAVGSASADGRAISSKNRDINNMQVLFFVEPEVGYKYIGMMSAGAVGIAQGLNEKGVAIGHTWMPVPEFYEGGYSPFMVNQMVMENCADVYEAVSYIEDIEKGEGATYILSDPQIAAIVETVPSVIYAPDTAYEIYTDGAAVHTNHYVMEPFYSWVCDDEFGYFWTVSFARYDRGLELLEENPVVDAAKVMSFTRDLENWGCGSPNEVIEAHPEIPDECWSNGWPGFSICNARTCSATVFQCDIDYPEELSTMHISINNPAWSPYVPLHNGALNEMALASSYFCDYSDGTAWTDSMQLRSLCDWGEMIPTFEQWESGKAVENAASETAARALLASGDVEGACELITDSDGSIAEDGVALMEGLFDGSVPLELMAVPQEA